MAMSRSEQMARVGRRDTAPERALRRELWARGLRYRVDAKTPAGRADIVHGGRRVAVFVDGCFWHGCPRHYVAPRTREAFWRAKLRGNVERDRRQTLALEEGGWHVVRLWSCELASDLERCAGLVTGAWEGASLARERRWHVVEVVAPPGGLGPERRYLEDLRDPRRHRVVKAAHDGTPISSRRSSRRPSRTRR
ncbi:MAG: very short patch repair endonuclease [Planctomycetota bacterium]